MSIFDKPVRPQEDIRFEDLVDSSAKVKQGMEARVKVLFDKMWSLGERPEDMSDEDWATYHAECMSNDQKLLDKYDSDAISLFIWHSKAQELLALDPNYKVLVPPYTCTPQADGTVVLSEIVSE